MDRLNFNDVNNIDSELSEFESDKPPPRNLRKEDELYRKPHWGHKGLLHGTKHTKPSKRVASDLLDVEEGKRMRYHGLLAMDAYSRHKKMVNDYLLYYGGKQSDFVRDTTNDRTDLDVIHENNRFLWENDDDAKTWEQKLSKKYWDKLFKEYTICDLSLYKKNKIALRWRIEKEVVLGKGQFICGHKKCEERDGLRSWEVDFKYKENGEIKSALVKCRLCAECSYKLNYCHKKKEIVRTIPPVKKRKSKHKKKKKKSRSDNEDTSTLHSPETPAESESSSSAGDVWKKPLQLDDQKSREDDFDQYFNDMLL